MSDNSGATSERDSADPAAIVQRIDQLWLELQVEIDRWSEAELAEPGPDGAWSGKDILAHLGRWSDAAFAVVQAHLDGRSLASEYDDYETLNAQWAAEDASLSLTEVQARARTAHDQLRELLGGLAPEQWDGVVRDWVFADSVEHVEEHLAELRARAGRA